MSERVFRDTRVYLADAPYADSRYIIVRVRRLTLTFFGCRGQFERAFHRREQRRINRARV